LISLLLEFLPSRTQPTNVGEDVVGGKGTLIHCRWECKLAQPLWKTVWKIFKKELPYDSAIPLLGIYLKEC
jgi:hypothetical protein